jgi:glycosyltransferase involved in cell wall biosynthesis
MRLVHNGAPPVNRDDLPALRQTTRDQLGLAADEPLLLCLARIHPEKGQIVLVKALSRLASRGIRLPLLLVGDGELGAVRLEAARLGVLGQLITPGSTNAPLRYLAAADLFVLPSLTESFPNALVEAMQIGLPCVASDVGGVSEILSDGVTGLLVPPGDPEALAQALAQLVTDRPLAARLGEAAQRRVSEDFTLEGMVRRIEDILLELTGEDRHEH